MAEAYDATLAGMPLAMLSGQYNQNYWPKDGLSSVMETYNKRQPARDVAAARQGVAASNAQERENAAYAEEKSRMAAELQAAEDELKQLEERKRLLLITRGQVYGDESIKSMSFPTDIQPPQYNPLNMDWPGAKAQDVAEAGMGGYTPSMAGYRPSTAGKY